MSDEQLVRRDPPAGATMPNVVHVRARIAAGWEPVRAASTPVAQKARLTPAEAEQVRVSTAPATELALVLGVTVRQVQRIRAGRAWKVA